MFLASTSVWTKRAEIESVYYSFMPDTFLPNSLVCSYIAVDIFDIFIDGFHVNILDLNKSLINIRFS